MLHARHPVHVTLRFIDGLPTMRRRDAFRAIRAAMLVVLPRQDFRLVHLSIQSNHLHILCEAAGTTALSRGMQAFKISATRKLNKVLGRTGTVFADRYHEEIITTPTQMRAALCYVMNNWRRHGEDRGTTVRVDPFATGMHFRGWKERDIPPVLVIPDGVEILPSSTPQTWLLNEGWQRGGPPIGLFERPGPRS